MNKYNKKAHYKQNSKQLTLQEVLNIIVSKTGSHPKINGRSYIFNCPSHEDKHASFSVSQGDDGTILFYCFVGCTIHEICTSLGIAVKDLFPLKKMGTSNGR